MPPLPGSPDPGEDLVFLPLDAASNQALPENYAHYTHDCYRGIQDDSGFEAFQWLDAASNQASDFVVPHPESYLGAQGGGEDHSTVLADSHRDEEPGNLPIQGRGERKYSEGDDEQKEDQETYDAFVPEPSGSDVASIAQSTNSCLQVFEHVSTTLEKHQHVSQSPGPQVALNDCLSRFRIWAGNIGAWHSPNDKRSADWRMRDAHEVRQRTLEILSELLEVMDEILQICSGSRPNQDLDEGETSDDSGAEGTDELYELCLSVGDIVTSLMKVSILIRKATGRDRYAKAAASKDSPFLVDFDIRHVGDKFSKARSQQWLLERLGSAISQRRQYLRYARDHEHRIAHEPSLLEPASNVLLPSPSQPVATTLMPSIAQTVSTRPTLAPTTASTLQAEYLNSSDLQDLDQDVDDTVSESTSFVSSRSPSDGPDKLGIVPLTEVSKEGNPFKCPYCCGIVQAKRPRSWKKHVFSDLRAYVCTFDKCNAGLFEDRETWIRHEINHHRRQWSCTSCHGETSFDSSAALERHLRKQHNEGSLDQETLLAIAAASSRPLAEISASDCPLCDDWDEQLREEAQQRGIDIPSSHAVKITIAKFQQHLGAHLEQLALFAVPPTIEGNLESGSKQDHDASYQDQEKAVLLEWNDLDSIPIQLTDQGLEVVGKATAKLLNGVIRCQLDMVLDAMNEGADCNMILPDEVTTDPDRFKGKTVLHLVAMFESLITTLRALVSYPTLDLNKKDAHGLTPLHVAVACGNIEAVKILLQMENIEINACEPRELKTPLSMAAELVASKATAMSYLLIQSGANPDAGQGIYAPICNQRVDIVELFIRSGADVNNSKFGFASPLVAATSRADLKMMALLMDHGAWIDVEGAVSADNYGTPLCTAVVRGSVDAVELLLERGADPAIAGPRGLPLSIAKMEFTANPSTAPTYQRIIQLLESHPAISQASGKERGSDQFTPGDIVYISDQEPGDLKQKKPKAVVLRPMGHRHYEVVYPDSRSTALVLRGTMILKTTATAEEAAEAVAIIREHTEDHICLCCNARFSTKAKLEDHHRDYPSTCSKHKACFAENEVVTHARHHYHKRCFVGGCTSKYREAEIWDDDEIRDHIIDKHLFGRETRVRIVEPPTDEAGEETRPKGILKRPTAKFPEDPNMIREGVAPLKDVNEKGIPPGARWTKIDRNLVNPEALDDANERYEEYPDYVVVLRALPKEDIQRLADRTKELRDRRFDDGESVQHTSRHGRNRDSDNSEDDYVVKPPRMLEAKPGKTDTPFIEGPSRTPDLEREFPDALEPETQSRLEDELPSIKITPVADVGPDEDYRRRMEPDERVSDRGRRTREDEQRTRERDTLSLPLRRSQQSKLSLAPNLDTSSYTPADVADVAESLRPQKHPATFQCTLCPKRFTRAYNLRSHLRTHTDERPFVCTICGKAFARQHDRKRHEGLHSGEKKFVCRGPLQSGSQWGCGRRFARADALGRHFRSEAGRVCILPLIQEEIDQLEAEKKELRRQRTQVDIDSAPIKSDPETQPEHDTTPASSKEQKELRWFERKKLVDDEDTFSYTEPAVTYRGTEPRWRESAGPRSESRYLPAALLQQYPALADMDWNDLPQDDDPPGEEGQGDFEFADESYQST